MGAAGESGDRDARKSWDGFETHTEQGYNVGKPCYGYRANQIPHPVWKQRAAVWSAFLLCIAVSLAANIAAAPTLSWQPVLVAGWPPVALLLAVELLAHRPRQREHTETAPATADRAGCPGGGPRDREHPRDRAGDHSRRSLAG